MKRMLTKPEYGYLVVSCCKECGGLAKKEEFGFSCPVCKSFLVGEGIDWYAPIRTGSMA